MRKFLLIFAACTASAAAAEPAPTANGEHSRRPAQAQLMKKRICERIDENPSSRLGNRKICRTIFVPAQQSGTENPKRPQPPAPTAAASAPR